MSGADSTPGSSRLTAEQQREMQLRYGVRYLHVQDGVQGVGANRADRRRRKHRRRDLG